MSLPQSNAGIPAIPWLSTKLRRFVAVSLVLHLGAGLSWGVPAYQQAREDARLLAEAETAKREAAVAAREEVEAARQEQLAKVAERIAERLRVDHDRLVGADIPEPERSQLFEAVLARLDQPMTELARALVDASASENDLRNLDAELRREQIYALDKALDELGPDAIAERFREEVASTVVPQLAQGLRADFTKRAVAPANSTLTREQKAAAAEEARLRKEAVDQLADAAAKATIASTATTATSTALEQRAASAEAAKPEDAKARGEQAKRLGNDLERLAKEAERLEGQIRKAVKPASEMDEEAGSASTAAAEAISAARKALGEARSAAKTGKDADAAKAAEQASQRLADAAAKASAAATAAGEAVRREAEIARLVAERAAEMAAAAESAFTEAFLAQTAPAVADQLGKAFAARLQASGVTTTEELVKSMRDELHQLLAARVPELAALGEATLTALPAAPAAATTPASKATTARAERAATAVASALTKGATEVGSLKRNIKVGGATSAAGQELSLRERVEYLARGVAAGRADIASASAVGELTSLRAEALAATAGAHGATTSVDGRIGLVRPRQIAPVDSEEARRIGAITADREEAEMRGGRWLAAYERIASSQAEGRGPAEIVRPSRPIGDVALATPAPWRPTFETIRFASIPCFTEPPVIDGDPSEWAAIPELELRPEGGTGPERQTLQMAWDPGGLNVLVTLRWDGHKPKRVGLNQFWTGDGIELWIDGLNSKEKVRDLHAGHQFFAFAGGSIDDPPILSGESRKPRNQGYQIVGFRAGELPVATRVRPDGWTMELRVPAALIRNADLTPGRLLGFNAYLNTANRDGRNYFWATGKAAQTWQHPNTWGDILLAGSDGTLEVVDAEGKPIAGSLSVGQPVRLLVRDRDMDLDPQRVDQVLATVRTRGGSVRTAVLDETGPSTGVFTGSLGTALALDEDPAGGALGVFEGEYAEAVYIDQARANGARNAEVRRPFAFGSAVAVTAR